MRRTLPAALLKQIGDPLDLPHQKIRTSVISGGCINDCFGIRTDPQKEPIAFLKVQTIERLDTFRAEMHSLNALASAGEIRVPKPIAIGETLDKSWLLLEYLPLVPLSMADQDRLGRELARLHRHRSADGRHGWKHSNYIGSTPQRNDWAPSWNAFFCEHRLRPQLELARKNGHLLVEPDRLMAAAHRLLHAHQPDPSLLHGDLWSGNAGALANGTPVLFDPASYYGDRETDLAFTAMFGGFSARFYQGYSAEWPLPQGAEKRATLYNLYHQLNHLNLFGEPYGRQARACMEELLDY